MPAPREVVELVEKFDRNQDYYRSDQYNEEQLRSEFIIHFFAALGWDTFHKLESGSHKRE